MNPDSAPAGNYPAFLRELADKLHLSARVDTVYGEHRTVDGRTFIPVARVAYGLGGGYGRTAKEEGRTAPRSGGGGITVTPIGVVEITAESTRFVPIPTPRTRLAALLLTALAAGVLLARPQGR